ncbi:uncharacterized protein A1O9_07830 [Exophiala aquamarina CBS 119918]|uniref:chitinase n=1 Tax=Exophiala aquamarina CBS 119918 TaxID=1182545 RepID=A0A072P826_9EURO|nr:uncharacterized protein A1O9_07830 [Exophiala aquamarina CBS 119918]KEF56249.1 hypothetical protein A1O9_07830 [Exophiala aquamarina CBS 119918]
MIVMLRLLFLISIIGCLSLCLASKPHILQVVTDLQADLEALKQIQSQYVSDIAPRDRQFFRPGSGPPFGNGGFRRPPRPLPPPPPPPAIDIEKLSALIESFGKSLGILIEFIKNNVPDPSATSSLTGLPGTSTPQSTASTTSTSPTKSSRSMTYLTHTTTGAPTGSLATTELGSTASDASTSTTALNSVATTLAPTTITTTTDSTSVSDSTARTPSLTTSSSNSTPTATDGTITATTITPAWAASSDYTTSTSTSISETTGSISGVPEATSTGSETSTTADTSSNTYITTTSTLSFISTSAGTASPATTGTTTTGGSFTTTESTTSEYTKSTSLETITIESTTYTSFETTTTESPPPPDSSTTPETTTKLTTSIDITATTSIKTTADTGFTRTSSLVTTTTTTTTATPAGPTYFFDPAARNLNLVYYGQTTSDASLTSVCADDSVDIITIGFITRFFLGGEVNITMNQGSHCWAPNQGQQGAGAWGLKDCVGDGFAAEIKDCQDKGKKVLISAGGVFADLNIPSEPDAEILADRLWNLFLGGVDTGIAPTRPYGPVVLDGIDFDNEKPENKQYLPKLASTLRQLMASDSTKAYYLTAAPQCPLPDLSNPIAELLPSIDFFSVQFYNNPPCQLNAGQGFLDSLQDWSDILSGTKPVPAKTKLAMKKRRAGGPTTSPRRLGSGSGSEKVRNGAFSRRMLRNGKRQQPGDTIDIGFFQLNNGISMPLMLIGTPAFNWTETQDIGYVTIATYKELLVAAREKNLPNLAGAMFWDGGYQSRSAQEVDGELQTYAEVARDILRIPHV